MKLVLKRRPSHNNATIGELFVGDSFICYSLEDEIREVLGKPVADWKVHGATAIPAGTYQVVLQNSNRFGPNTPTLLDVPGYSYIRMHSGNTAADTEGCLLLGLGTAGSKLAAGTSKPAVLIVQSLISQALEAGESVTITIQNPVGA